MPNKSKRTLAIGAPTLERRMTFGLDIGYGATKVVTDHTTLLFPSVMGYAKTIKFQADEIQDKYAGDQIQDEEGKWFVGELALSQLPAGDLYDLKGRTADESTAGNRFRVRLMKLAIGKLFAGVLDGDVVHLQIATGLPVDHMPDAPALKAALLGQHRVMTDTAHLIANVTQVYVMPQPYGTIYGQSLTETGAINVYHTAQRTGVVDVGRYTVDITLDDEGEYIDSASGSVEAGVYTAQQRIGEMLEAQHRQKFSLKYIEQVLRDGSLNIYGKPMDYRRQVEDALQPLRAATLKLMREKWGAGKTVDVIYLSGGGAELVYEQIIEEYPQAKLAPHAQMANARGYLNYAHFDQQA